MSNTKIKNQLCDRCEGAGKTKMLHLETLKICFMCDGYGYRVLYLNKDGYERTCTVEEWKWQKYE